MNYTSANNVLQSWAHHDAKRLGFQLILRFGEPNFILPDKLQWNMPLPYINHIILANESIPYNFPLPHKGFVYSVSRISTTPEQAATLTLIDPNFIIDQLKETITIRSNTLFNNQISLGFAYDFTQNQHPGDISTLKQDYSYRLNNHIISKSGKFNPVYGIENSHTNFNSMNSLLKASQWMFRKN